MHILNDFFLLNWNENSELINKLPDIYHQNIFVTFDNNFEDFCDSCSILLIVNSKNFEKIINTKEFKLIFNGIFKDSIIDKCLILQLQKRVLEFIIDLGNSKLNKILKNNFEVLRKEGIITYYISRRLIGFFGLIEVKKDRKLEIKLKKAKGDDNFYKNSINLLQISIENLKQCIEVDAFKQKLMQLKEKLEDQRFSIGVTGVINAGKSTMLNALLREQLLGTSVVPETANLTILKYSKERFAKVNFWNKEEFAKIEKSASENKSIKKFIDETKDYFGVNLGEYIKEKSRIDRVKIEELSLFTSVKESNKKCNLVKSVELYSDLKFLQDGVEIVDTPGLDDPIIQREEITVKYVSQCDLMIHLMNVNQSATKKDIDFIIDSIIYQNIAKLLIVITRIDTVSKDELSEVINYTKQSIETRLKEQNKSHKLKSIIQKLDFIPISGKAALYLRVNREKEAQEMGYDFESSGILVLEKYLTNVLFGANSEKANLIIKSNNNELISILSQQKNIFEQETLLLNKSSIEIKKEYEQYSKKRQNLLSVLSKIKKNIDKQEEELREYFKILHKFSDAKLLSLRDLVKSRVIDDVSYEMRKNRKYPKKERIEYIIENGIKDGIIDLIRDYRYEFQKKMRESFEIIKRDFNDAKEVKDYQNYDFDVREFFQKQFKTFMVFQNRETLRVKVNENIKKYAKNSTEKLDSILQDLLQETLNELKKSLDLKLEDINEGLLCNFIQISKKRVKEQESDINLQDNLMQTTIKNIRNSALNKEQRLKDIESKLKALAIIDKELNFLSKESE